MTRILYEGFRLSGKVTRYLTEETNLGLAMGTNRTHYSPQRNVRCVNLGKALYMRRFSVVWSILMFWISRKSSFVFRKEFLYFPLSLSCRTLVKCSKLARYACDDCHSEGLDELRVLEIENISDIHIQDTSWWGGFMKYVVEIGSGFMISYISSIINIDSGIQNLMGEGALTHIQMQREHSDLVSLLFFIKARRLHVHFHRHKKSAPCG